MAAKKLKRAAQVAIQAGAGWYDANLLESERKIEIRFKPGFVFLAECFVFGSVMTWTLKLGMMLDEIPYRLTALVIRVRRMLWR